VLPKEEQAGATPLSPRCVKDQIGDALHRRHHEPFSELGLVHFDTASSSIEEEGGETLGLHGHGQDHRPELEQMVVGMIRGGEGHPVSRETWPGNATDPTTSIPAVDRLRRRIGMPRVDVGADRGRTSRKTLEASRERTPDYALDARRHRRNEVAETVLARAGRFHEVTSGRRKKKASSPPRVEQARVAAEDGERCHAICRGEDEAREDAHDREAIDTTPREALRRGEKSLVGNSGYRRLLRTMGRATRPARTGSSGKRGTAAPGCCARTPRIRRPRWRSPTIGSDPRRRCSGR